MGASSVEAAAQPKNASDPTLKSYKYIILKDKESSANLPDLPQQTTVVSWAWVKDCLIAGRILLPM
jgi:hypothetical protein